MTILGCARCFAVGPVELSYVQHALSVSLRREQAIPSDASILTNKRKQSLQAVMEYVVHERTCGTREGRRPKALIERGPTDGCGSLEHNAYNGKSCSTCKQPWSVETDHCKVRAAHRRQFKEHDERTRPAITSKKAVRTTSACHVQKSPFSAYLMTIPKAVRLFS